MNWALMRHPINWLYVWIMATIGFFIVDIVLKAWVSRDNMGANS